MFTGGRALIAGGEILLVEQNANLALHLAYRGYVLDTGDIVAEGTSKELLGNPDVKKAYLGRYIVPRNLRNGLSYHTQYLLVGKQK